MPRKNKRPKKAPTSAAIVNDTDSAASFEEHPADEVQVPDLDDAVEEMPRAYKKMYQKKQFTKEGMRTLAGLTELFRRVWPEDYLIMTSEDGCMAPSFLLKPPAKEDLKQWCAAEILRLQGTCGVSKEGQHFPYLTV